MINVIKNMQFTLRTSKGEKIVLNKKNMELYVGQKVNLKEWDPKNHVGIYYDYWDKLRSENPHEVAELGENNEYGPDMTAKKYQYVMLKNVNLTFYPEHFEPYESPLLEDELFEI